MLSPTNKKPGDGQNQYLRKQRENLGSQVHLTEIDLLRAGEHATCVPRWRIEEKAGDFDYHVALRRFHEPDDFIVYPIQLQESLPPIAVPLLPDDGSVEVDLQAVFDRCYDAGPYAREIDYLHDAPQPPLTRESRRSGRGS